MNLVATLVAIIVVIVGAIYTRYQPSSEPLESPQKEALQKKQPTQESEQKQPTPIETPTLTPAPTEQPKSQQSDEPGVRGLRYPNAVYIRSEADASVYQSGDDPDAITDWYKEKIESLGMTAKSFVKTRTNDNVLNKLVGADGEREIRVEISKPADSVTTTIKLTTLNV